MNRPQLIIFGAIGVLTLLAVLVILGVLPGLKPRLPAPFTLAVWGLDDATLWSEVGTRYRATLPTATIAYVRKDPKTYEAELLNALAAGQGPDIFLIRDTWISRHRDKLKPLPDGTSGYQKKTLRNTFADAAASAVTDEKGALLGVPLSLDTLSLFFNRDYFNAANIPNPPVTWDDLAVDATRLTRLSAVGGIERSGLAAGTAANVEHAVDIVLAFILQAGGTLTDPAVSRITLASDETAGAVNYYTGFADATRKTYSWNAFFGNSLEAFAKGDTAMAFGYAADVGTVVALNPQLNFDIAPLPQPARAPVAITLGRFDLLTVSRTSTQSDQAWNFLLWFSGKDAQKFYADEIGLPSARRDLVTSAPPRDYLATFYDQVLLARPRPVLFGDSLDRIFSDMITAAAGSRRANTATALSRAVHELEAVMHPPK